MHILLYLLAFLAVFGGMAILSVAKSALHEIEVYLLFLIGAICLSGASIVQVGQAIRRVLERQEESRREQAHGEAYRYYAYYPLPGTHTVAVWGHHSLSPAAVLQHIKQRYPQLL